MIRKFFFIFLVLSLPMSLSGCHTDYWDYDAPNAEIISPDGQVYEMVEDFTVSPSARLGEKFGQFYGGLLDNNFVVSIPGLSSKEWVIQVFEGSVYLYKKKGMTTDKADLEKLEKIGENQLGGT